MINMVYRLLIEYAAIGLIVLQQKYGKWHKAASGSAVRGETTQCKTKKKTTRNNESAAQRFEGLIELVERISLQGNESARMNSIVTNDDAENNSRKHDTSSSSVYKFYSFNIQCSYKVRNGNTPHEPTGKMQAKWE